MAKDKSQKNPKVLFGQNISTRVRSPLFWTGIVGILGSAVVSFGGLIGLDLSAQVDSVTANSSKIIEGLFLILGLFGVSVDPNSKGHKDSEIVRTDYKKPRNDKDPNEFVQWQVDSQKQLDEETKKNAIDKADLGIYTPVEYDDPEPDTDDSDEVEYDVAEYEYDENTPKGGSNLHDDSELEVNNEEDRDTVDKDTAIKEIIEKRNDR